MDPVLVASLAVAAAGTATVAVGLRHRAAPDLADRLADLDVADTRVDPVLGESLAVRVLRPLATGLTDRIGALTPTSRLAALRHRLAVAGLAGRVSAEEFLAIQLLALVGGVVLAGLFLTNPTVDGPRRLATAALTLGIGAMAPHAWLARRQEARTAAVRRDLPDVLDLLAISVEAGVGLEGAIAVVTANFDSPLADELQHTLREMELGLSRREALDHLRGRTDVRELSSFVSTLVQADALGTPLSRVLRAQAEEMRIRRRQTARETAAKLPVKMLFPMTLFILPAIFVVTLGPAAIQLLRVFS